MKNTIRYVNLIFTILLLIVSYFKGNVFICSIACLLILISKFIEIDLVIFVTFLFNLYYTQRFILVSLFNWELLFGNTNNLILIDSFGLCFILYALIVISLLLFKNNFTNTETNPIKYDKMVAFAKLSVFLTTIPIIFGAYKIGVPIQNPVALILVKVGLYFQILIPFIFKSSNRIFYLTLISIGGLIFGSKAFLYILMFNYLIYALVFKEGFKKGNNVLLILGGLISIILFPLINVARSIKEFTLFDILELFQKYDFSDLTFLNIISQRFGGLDTFYGYYKSGFNFSLMDLVYEFVIVFNYFSPFKIEIPHNYLTVEYFTAYYFSGYNFNSIDVDELHHTDSMLGFSRMAALPPVLVIIFLFLIFFYPVICNYKNKYFNKNSLLLFYISIFTGGTYNETIILVIQLLSINLLINLSYKLPRLQFYINRFRYSARKA